MGASLCLAINSAALQVSNVLNAWDLSNVEGNVPYTYPSQVRWLAHIHVQGVGQCSR